MQPQNPNGNPVEQHPLGFFLPENARLLMLGSFPPKRERWSMEFYYPNFQNDMWRIVGHLFFGDREHFFASSRRAFDAGKIKAFCTEKGIALGDTAESVIRLQDNASDKFLQVVSPLRLQQVLPRIPRCRTLAVTGQKALETLLELLPPVTPPATGAHVRVPFPGHPFDLYRMPSTSRAYPLPLEQKAVPYRILFRAAGILPAE